jgi:hypothetical protein
MQPYMKNTQFYTSATTPVENKNDDYFTRSSIYASKYNDNNSNNDIKYIELKHKRTYWPLSMIDMPISMAQPISTYMKPSNKHVRFADAPYLESIVYIDNCKNKNQFEPSFLDDIKYSDFYI